MARINDLNMTTMDVLVALSDGNPGALRVMMELRAAAPDIDPQSALGSMGPLLMLDTLGIYGPHIWLLFKDICDQKPVRVLAVLRAVQLGLLSEATLKEGIRSAETGKGGRLARQIVSDLHAKVCEQLSEFQKPEAPVDAQPKAGA